MFSLDANIHTTCLSNVIKWRPKRLSFFGLQSICRKPSAFTLLEMMVAVTILTMILATLGLMMLSSMKVWQKASLQTERSRGVRQGIQLERILSQATLFWHYEYAQHESLLTPSNEKSFVPDSYARYSDLRFRCGLASTLGISNLRNGEVVSHAVFFQAPLGIREKRLEWKSSSDLLNTVGFYVEYGDFSEENPKFVKKSQKKFRLMQMVEPAEFLSIAKYTSRSSRGNANGKYQGSEWYKIPLSEPSYSYVVAENVIALVLRAHDGKNQLNTYDYDSSIPGKMHHELPPTIEMTMIFLDEKSAQTLTDLNAVDVLDLSSYFQETSNYEDDLLRIQKDLTSKKLSFQVISHSVTLENSTWNSSL